LNEDTEYTKIILVDGISFTGDVIDQKIGNYTLKKATYTNCEILDDGTLFDLIKKWDPYELINRKVEYYYLEKGIDSCPEKDTSNYKPLDKDDLDIVASFNLIGFYDFTIDAVFIFKNKSSINPTKSGIRYQFMYLPGFSEKDYPLKINKDNIKSIKKINDILFNIRDEDDKWKFVLGYLNGFWIRAMIPQFIYKMAVLESLIGGNSELSFRLSRSIAILIGKDEENSEDVFNSFKKIYSKRSNFLHGSNSKDEIQFGDYKKLSEYLIEIMLIIINPNVNIKDIYEVPKIYGFGSHPFEPIIEIDFYATDT